MKTKFTIFFFALALCINMNIATAQVNAQDSLALVDLFNSTNGANWTRNVNWLTLNPVSTWYGITTSGTRVTGINLDSNNLVGTLPTSLGNLTNLDSLKAFQNQLSGTIPSEIGNLINLVYIRLSLNQLSGGIPSTFVNLTNLRILDMGGNQLTGGLPTNIGNLVHLDSVYLPFNLLSGSIPSSIGNCVNLRDLNLRHNQFTDSIPSSIGNLINLRRLRLNNNQLSGSIPDSVNKLVNLHELDLSTNQLSGTIPPLNNLGPLNDPDSGVLDLSNNRFTYDGMELIVQTFPNAVYAPQAIISLHQNGDSLSVFAGGTLSNNIYKWFNIDQNDTTRVKGDSVFHPSLSGHYFAKITNAICTQLRLRTDTILVTATLPVTIINLKAQQQKSIIEIDWTSGTEINVAKYEIQRSFNALNFSTIGSLTAKGNGIQKMNYTFNDAQPLQGANYYRIKAADKDGRMIYSNTIMINVGNDRIITTVYPNPAKNILHVETNGAATFSLVDQSGKILLTTSINGKGVINISGIPAGTYFLKNNSTGNVQKIIIAR